MQPNLLLAWLLGAIEKLRCSFFKTLLYDTVQSKFALNIFLRFSKLRVALREAQDVKEDIILSNSRK